MTAVDEFDLAEASDDGDDRVTTATRTGRRRPSRPWPWVLAALALVGVGAVNAQPTAIVFGLGDGAQLGLLELDITDAPTVVWETESGFPLVVSTQGSRAVVLDDDGVERSVLGIDLATGDEVWRHQDKTGTCSWERAVVCVDDAGTDAAVIVTIAVADGTRQTRPHPDAVAAVAAGEDLVIIEATEDVTEVVVLVQPDGTERWRVAMDAADTESDPIWAGLSINGGRVTVGYSGSQLDLATGAQAEVPRYPIADGVEVEMAEDGAVAFVGPDGRVLLAENERWLPIDDDLGGPIVLQQNDPNLLVAVRRGDGTELWRLDAEDCFLTARLRGTAVTECWDLGTDRVLAVDLLTGERRWELTTATVVGATADTLLAVEVTEGMLLAIDPVDGSTRWSVSITDMGYANVTELSDGILVATESGLVRLQWD